jgi:serine/threonine protein kinase
MQVEEEIKFSRAVAVSEEAKDFIMVCLKKDPRDRYTVPELLEHPFLAVEGAAISELF